MRNPIAHIFALFMIISISACTAGSTPWPNQQPAGTVVLEIIETRTPSEQENLVPTENPTTTTTSIPKSTSTTETIPSETLNIIPSATNTPKPSPTIIFEPAELLAGNFYGVDENHLGSGKAVIFQTQVDEYSLHLENFEVTSGPGLHVILAEDDNPYNIATLGDYLDLGELESTRGDQIYGIPNDVNLDKYGSVVIYCVPFRAIFAIAPLR